MRGALTLMLGRREMDLWLSGGLLGLIALVTLVGPWLWPLDPLEADLLSSFSPPLSSSGDVWHPLGTDQLGRDLLARLLEGGRLSVAIVLCAGMISLLIGTTVGMLAGYFGGWVDALIMRLVDIQLAIPFILLILLLVSVIGPGIGNLVAVLGLTGWAIYARVARARTLELRELEYMEATKALGLPLYRTLLRHLLPNLFGAQLVLFTLDLPRLVVLEASVGFLGMGIQPPAPTLGNLIGEGRSYLLVADWLVIWPGVLIAALVVGCNFFGDALARRYRIKPR
ncbi:peptide ABC transporter permease [Halotalea alkalilenta]|uniref:Peptide ABC transporter permease n=2 Tax=Halotalea alkalilenta TaxID=376489 RepID=A0A172YAP6_9GAMM|nr:peptide ABC transporter permease [Halotalea alkalilenta]